ncbi:hypothetical protein NXW84_01520 [Bacteroides fragilis]|nr:hypothetical protein NXW84_01520 [Bacteroides fragilis]
MEELPVIFASQIQVLRSIKKICDKHHTNLKFVIGPDYYQKKASQEDIKILKAILGDSAVWDFTGINEYTADIHHYYEPGSLSSAAGSTLTESHLSGSRHLPQAIKVPPITVAHTEEEHPRSERNNYIKENNYITLKT